MKKVDFVKRIVEKVNKNIVVDATNKEAAAYFDAVVEALVEVIGEKESVQLPGVGTFNVGEVPKRRGIIRFGDRKGEPYVVPAHEEPKFKMSGVLKKMFVSE